MNPEKIGPEKAAELLRRPGVNRRRRDGYVDWLAGAMKRGEWEVNGEAIKIARSGRVLDGQHRLAAIIKAGVPITTYVIRDLPDNMKTVNTFDGGRKRTSSDRLTVIGEVSTNVLAAALIWVYRDCRGTSHVSLTGSGPRSRPTHPQLLEVLQTHPEIRESIGPAGRTKHLLPISLGVYLHWKFRWIDADCADQYFADLIEGYDLSRGDPVRWLRERLLLDRGSKARLRKLDIAALAIKAWNHRRMGNYQLRSLRWTASGSHAEPFPIPV